MSWEAIDTKGPSPESSSEQGLKHVFLILNNNFFLVMKYYISSIIIVSFKML